MLGLEELKEHIKVSDKLVECPVKGCDKKVSRQVEGFRRKRKFQCPEHRIYISPTTFEYEFDTDNLLWRGREDLELLNGIKALKGESGMARDDSEDAVTWNVFRFLDRRGLVAEVMGSLLDTSLEGAETMYWSYNPGEGAAWSKLRRARREFGERPRIGAGPDLLIASPGALVFIEARLTSDNESVPRKDEATKSYLTGGQFWFPRVFLSDYRTIAVEEKRYEPMRFWLLGSWIAARMGIDFYLVNLVPEGKEQDIEKTFGAHLRAGEERVFRRLNWEDIYREILKSDTDRADKEKVTGYMENKSAGYDRKGELRGAFRLR
ncbi:MAG: hypothetical protein SWK76_15185 [Actinomycetota bacterium]|nr:hypothetical protein [Actinomycetota bacterium]